ncbi:DegT/DnrJ/EryC1/StrS family aminotransferase [Variovorax sp. LjRoot290]|uniref:DegT/DnrJ/EryC1/StrS family aminotransferase n=1 Tax=Variovorax sp. LjRoot290 TaxID=3342316 RepID=UPI003ECE7828
MPQSILRLSIPNLPQEAIDRTVAVLRSGQLVHGAEGEAFEAELAQHLGARHAVLVSSGTAALHLALMALGIGAGDSVLVPNFTFPATGNVVKLVGAQPVLVDVDPSSYCITPASASAALGRWRSRRDGTRLRAVIPVHEFGHPADMVELSAWAEKEGLVVIEDAACAIGAQSGGRPVGTFGAVGCFSLHPRKTLTTGEGGLLISDSGDLVRRLRRLRSHGMERTSAGMVFHEAGYNYRLTNLQSALGRAQLPHLGDWIAARRELATSYHEALQSFAASGYLIRPASCEGHSWQTYMVVLADWLDRAAVIKALAADGIEGNLGAQCLSELPPFHGLAASEDDMRHARRLYRQGLALPFCEQYGSEEVGRVVAALGRAIELSQRSA